jgi:hypothetical protein
VSNRAGKSPQAKPGPTVGRLRAGPKPAQAQ